jgi:hypothetical protein
VALLEVGLQKILINVGEEDGDNDEIYHLPVERTLENVLRFKEILVNHRGSGPRGAHATVLVGSWNRARG